MTREERAAHVATLKRWYGAVRSISLQQVRFELRAWSGRHRRLAVRLAAAGMLSDPATLTPEYLRPSYAEEPRRR